MYIKKNTNQALITAKKKINKPHALKYPHSVDGQCIGLSLHGQLVLDVGELLF